MFCLEQAVYMYMYMVGDSGFALLWQIDTYFSLKVFVCCNSILKLCVSMYGGKVCHNSIRVCLGRLP